ncbi:MAG: hypothetical protein LBH05_05400 [Deferribacteraceae bacterium]|jgi:exopolyphosphatase/guanosine-5'-triphosphate,3'-diphosphate pyrophosphatase|nr:hypothetical protein [Deferribacteraceae bacterium]
MKKEIIGIINVGASAFRMHIGEYSGEHSKTLDFLVKPLHLGTDTFTQGYISLDNVKKASKILNIFRLKLEEYNITNYKALCTSGVREATNKDFFMDYTLLHSGIKLEVLNPSEEIYIKYIGARNSVYNFLKMEHDGLVFANVSSGNITLNITLKDRIMYAGTLPFGSLRIQQMFRSIPHIKRYRAIEEYVRTMILSVAATIDPSVKLNHLLGAGSSINMLLRLIKPQENVITLKRLETAYERVRTLTSNEVIEETGLRSDENSVLVPTLITYIKLMELIGAEEFFFSRTPFPELMSHYYAGRIKDLHINARIKNTLLSIADKYRADTRHAKWINFFAKKLFDGLDDLHSLDKNFSTVLETAVILNDVGRYVTDDDLAGNSFYIIKSLTIPGVDDRMLLMAACIVYEANKTALNKEPQEYMNLTSSEYLTIRKLAGILRVAKALDAGRNRYITDIYITMSDMIIIDAHADREPYLEIAAFENQKQLFIETFGVSIELRARIRYE